MLNSLYIKNYRNLEELEIKKLGRVNLLTGKNNTGKSSVLEALAIFASGGDLRHLLELLKLRGEIGAPVSKYIRRPEVIIKSLISLFFNRKIDLIKKTEIKIGGIHQIVPNITIPDFVLLSFLNFKDNSLFSDDSIPLTVLTYESYKSENNLKIAFDIDSPTSKHSYITFSHEFLKRIIDIKNNSEIDNNIKYINSRDISNTKNAILWDNIALSDKQEKVINCLRILEPEIIGLAFVQRSNLFREPVIKLDGHVEVLPLFSMGDGINRILSLVLALVNCEGGFLLIDEFENGLHHTVQEKVWKILLQVAEELDVQIFATTHSEDCIRSFTKVLLSEEQCDGRLIRLENRNGKIVAEEYNKEQLEIVEDNGIEIR